MMSPEMRANALEMRQSMKQKMTLAELVPDTNAEAKKPRSIGLENEKLLQNVFDVFADPKLGRVVLSDYNPDKQMGAAEQRLLGTENLRSSERLNDMIHAFGLTRYSSDGDQKMGPGRGFCPHEIQDMCTRFFEEQEFTHIVRQSKDTPTRSSKQKIDKNKKISFLEMSMLVSKEPDLCRKWEAYFQSRVNDVRMRKDLNQSLPEDSADFVEPDASEERFLDPHWQLKESFKILTSSHGKKDIQNPGKHVLDIQVLRNVLASCGDELLVERFDEFMNLIGHKLRGNLDIEKFVSAVQRASHLESISFLAHVDSDVVVPPDVTLTIDETGKVTKIDGKGKKDWDRVKVGDIVLQVGTQAKPFEKNQKIPTSTTILLQAKEEPPKEPVDISALQKEMQVYGIAQLENMTIAELKELAAEKKLDSTGATTEKKLHNLILGSQVETKHLVKKMEEEKEKPREDEDPAPDPKEKKKGDEKRKPSPSPEKAKQEDDKPVEKKKSSKDAPEDKKKKGDEEGKKKDEGKEKKTEEGDGKKKKPDDEDGKKKKQEDDDSKKKKAGDDADEGKKKKTEEDDSKKKKTEDDDGKKKKAEDDDGKKKKADDDGSKK